MNILLIDYYKKKKKKTLTAIFNAVTDAFKK